MALAHKASCRGGSGQMLGLLAVSDLALGE
jgi:hypothetical protein